MTECERLSDRMPAVALGDSQWTPEEARHLYACTSCLKEWELLRVAGGMGQSAASAMNSSAVSTAVLDRLALTRTRRLRRRAWSFAAIAAAATIAAAVWTGSQAGPGDAAPVESGFASVAIPLPELEGLPPAALDSVLRSMDEPIPGSMLDLPELGELGPEELETVLESWEG